jgi:hypothetical protein
MEGRIKYLAGLPKSLPIVSNMKKEGENHTQSQVLPPHPALDLELCCWTHADIMFKLSQ